MKRSLTRGFPRDNPAEALRAAEQMVLRFDRGYTFMEEHLLELRRDLTYFEDRLEQSYWLSRSEFLLGSLRHTIGDRKSAIAHFEQAASLATDAVKLRGFSDGFRCLADALGQLLILRGLLYQITHGLRVREAVLQALELDWNNRRAHISAGAWYLNAPEVAGGDVEYAVEILAQTTADPNASDVERFLANGFLALGYEEINERNSARAAYATARDIFPRNPWLVHIASELEIKRYNQEQPHPFGEAADEP